MGLYLCVFDGEEELEGVEIGSYSDFNNLREYIVRHLEGGTPGSRFPNLILHSDSDGEWTVENCANLLQEIDEIVRALKVQPSVALGGWQAKAARTIGLNPTNAYESFIDVDGELVLERLRKLILVALEVGRPILFQ